MATNNSAQSYLTQLEDMLDENLGKKAPALPDNVKDAIVQFLPWITVVFIVLAVGVLLPLLGLGSLLAPFGMLAGVGYGFAMIITSIVAVVQIVLQGMAISGLFNKTRKGWQLLYYSTLVGLVGGIFSGNPVGAILGALITLYLLIQIKSSYK